MTSYRATVAVVVAALFAVAVPPAVAAPAARAADAGDATSRTVDQGAPEYYDSGLAPTPYMGWNTYYGLGAPTEQEVRSVADHLVSSATAGPGDTVLTAFRGVDGRVHQTGFPAGS